MRILIVEGNGLIARAFRTFGNQDIPGVIFARGVANSVCADESEYRRETSLLQESLALAVEINEPLVYFSGAPIYGDFSEIVTEETPCRPITKYGRHQAECEELIRGGNAKYLLARLSNAIGYSSNRFQLFPSLVEQILGGRVQVQKFASRDLIDVEDIVRLVQQLLALELTSQAVNIASGRSVVVTDIVNKASSLLGRSPAIIELGFGDAQRFSIRRLSSLVEVPPFEADYLQRTLARYATGIAALLESKALDAFNFDSASP